MKKGIHPDYHFVDVQLNDGTTYRTRTTHGTAGQKITLDIDPSTHPAWTGGQQQLLDRGGRLSRFQKKFAGFIKTGGETVSPPAKKEDKPAPKAEKPAKKK
jgi:large subunit ribosomal protein L31